MLGGLHEIWTESKLHVHFLICRTDSTVDILAAPTAYSRYEDPTVTVSVHAGKERDKFIGFQPLYKFSCSCKILLLSCADPCVSGLQLLNAPCQQPTAQAHKTWWLPQQSCRAQWWAGVILVTGHPCKVAWVLQGQIYQAGDSPRVSPVPRAQPPGQAVAEPSSSQDSQSSLHVCLMLPGSPGDLSQRLKAGVSAPQIK